MVMPDEESTCKRLCRVFLAQQRRRPEVRPPLAGMKIKGGFVPGTVVFEPFEGYICATTFRPQ
jgi:hypothetical protein